MAIADRIDEAVNKLRSSDYINALIQICIAIDATAKREYPGLDVGDRIKRFWRKNQDFFLSRHHLGNEEAIFLPLKDRTGKPDRRKLENIFYDIIRNGLLHEAELSDRVKCGGDCSFGVTDDGKFSLGPDVIWGMVYAVVGSSANSKERAPSESVLVFFDETVVLNDLWGKRDQVLRLARSLSTRHIPRHDGRPTPKYRQ